MKWHKMYFSGENTKQHDSDHIEYYYNDAGYRIYVNYTDFRHNKVYCYNVKVPNGTGSVGYKTLAEAQHTVRVMMEGIRCL